MPFRGSVMLHNILAQAFSGGAFWWLFSGALCHIGTSSGAHQELSYRSDALC